MKTEDRRASVDQLKNLAGTALCAMHPLADDQEIAEAHALMKNVEDSKLLLFRLRAPRVLPSQDTILSESILTDEDTARIDRFAFEAAAQWHTRIPTSHTVWSVLGGTNESDLGWLVEYRFAERLLQQAKFVATLQRAAAAFDPALVLVPGKWGSGLAEAVAKACGAYGARGARVAILPDSSLSAPAQVYEPAEIAALHKSLGDHLEQIVAVKHKSRHAVLHDSSFFRNEFRRHAKGRGMRVNDSFARFLPFTPAFAARAHAPFSGLRQRKVSKILAARWAEMRDQGTLRDAFVFDGINLYAAVEPYLEDLYTNIFPQLIAELRIRRNLMEATRVSCTVMNNDSLLSKKLEILAARQLGIPSLTVQHGMHGETNGEGTLFASHAAVWGLASADASGAEERSAGRVHVTGNPKYDGLVRTAATRGAEAGARETIVFAAQVAPLRSACDTVDEEEAYADAIAGLIRQFPAERFVVKLHPRQSDRMLTYYEEAVRDRQNVEVVRDVPIAALLTKARVLITESSTVGFEAVLLEVPILTLNLTRRPDLHPYGKNEVALCVRDADALADALRNVLDNPRIGDRLAAHRADFTAKYLHEPDARASERLLDLCTRLTND